MKQSDILTRAWWLWVEIMIMIDIEFSINKNVYSLFQKFFFFNCQNSTAQYYY